MSPLINQASGLAALKNLRTEIAGKVSFSQLSLASQIINKRKPCNIVKIESLTQLYPSTTPRVLFDKETPKDQVDREKI